MYLTGRSIERGTKAVKDLETEGLKPRFHPLDVDDRSSIDAFASFIKKEHGGLDVLVNNAAIAYKVLIIYEGTPPFCFVNIGLILFGAQSFGLNLYLSYPFFLFFLLLSASLLSGD